MGMCEFPAPPLGRLRRMRITQDGMSSTAVSPKALIASQEEVPVGPPGSCWCCDQSLHSRWAAVPSPVMILGTPTRHICEIPDLRGDDETNKTNNRNLPG